MFKDQHGGSVYVSRRQRRFGARSSGAGPRAGDERRTLGVGGRLCEQQQRNHLPYPREGHQPQRGHRGQPARRYHWLHTEWS